MTTHLSDADLRGYVTGELAPDELLSTDEHLARCVRCRQKANSLVAQGSESLHELESFGPHLSEEDVQRAAREEFEPGTAAAIRSHLRDCAVCADQVNDLRKWARESRPSRSVVYYYAAAAVLLLALILPATRWLAMFRADVPASLAGLASLTQNERDRVRTALENGEAEPPPFLKGLAGPREALMGEPAPGFQPRASQTFQPRAPIGTAILADRPVFEWTPLAGGGSYSVSIFDEALHLVLQSPEVDATTWQSTQTLARGRTYAWQVTARTGNRLVVTPTPPAPQARFRVLEGEVAGRLEEVAREHPSSHLLLGILYAQAGARLEAERHLRLVSELDRNREVARRSLDRLSAF